MDSAGPGLAERVIKRRGVLEGTREALKRYFHGIDDIIDSVVDIVTPWYATPELQELPLVVNLWGLTGTGKSSLVRRLAEELGFAERLYTFNLGLSDASTGINQAMLRIGRSVAEKRFILLFDEFQNARTIDDRGSETKPADLKLLWDILDSGIYHPLFSWSRDYDRTILLQFACSFRVALREGISIKDGRIEGDVALFKRILDRHTDDECIFTEREVETLCGCTGESWYDLRRRVGSMDSAGILALVESALEAFEAQQSVDCGKALVFVIGNIDEAFDMNGELGPDGDADQYRAASRRITIPRVKKALQKRFRSEQIARLGNNHLIYPALGSDAYRGIIAKRLDEIASRFMESTGVLLVIEDSIAKLVYEEGVYPAQGTRPLFSTIDRLVLGTASRFFAECCDATMPRVDRISLSWRGNAIRCEAERSAGPLFARTYEFIFELRNLRGTRRDDRQAIVSVHEAGHATLAVLLLHRLPSLIRSTSAESQAEGFVSGDLFDRIVVKGGIIDRLAVLLGGRAAEGLVFGEDAVTGGSSGDLAAATSFALEAAKTGGFSSEPLVHRMQDHSTNAFFHDADRRAEDEARRWIGEALRLATDTLREREDVLLAIAGALFERTCLGRDELLGIVAAHIPGFVDRELIISGSKGFYLSRFREKMQEKASVDAYASAKGSGSGMKAAYSRQGGT